MSHEPLIIAVLGAESTGKTSLAQGLSAHLSQTTSLRCTWVPEWLRQWCADQGRTPRADEQAAIAHTQHQGVPQLSIGTGHGHQGLGRSAQVHTRCRRLHLHRHGRFAKAFGSRHHLALGVQGK